ncbi:MAG: HTTM domain-containing protein [bacterium]|nr:HTTM domain-containing protein [bacterium]
MAILRIVWGTWCLFYVAVNIPHIELLFSNQGTTLPLLAFHILQPQSVLTAHLLFGILLLSYIGFIIGYQFRLSIGIIVMLSVYFWNLSMHPFPATFHRLYIVIFTVFLCSGADKTFSMWAKRTLGSWTAWQPISVLPQRILAMQLTVTYFTTGWKKPLVPGWEDGNILRYSFMSACARPVARAVAALQLPDVFYDTITYIVIQFELAMAFGFWIPKIRKWFFLGGALFHIGICIFLQIHSFLVLIPMYIVFLEPEVIQRWCEKFYK